MTFGYKMKLIVPIGFLFLVSFRGHATEQPKKIGDIRPPFSIHLVVPGAKDYYGDIKRAPYVTEKDQVIIFPGDHFGVRFETSKGKISRIVHEPRLSKASLEFTFFQDVKSKSEAPMTLILKNKTFYRIEMDGYMVLASDDSCLDTSILPLEPHLQNFESWSNPIAQLILGNIRISDDETEQDAAANP